MSDKFISAYRPLKWSDFEFRCEKHILENDALMIKVNTGIQAEAIQYDIMHNQKIATKLKTYLRGMHWRDTNFDSSKNDIAKKLFSIVEGEL